MKPEYRRIAQGQSASIHTEEAAAFDSCSAYQTPEILFLSHCVPNPPNKGEKIRAFHELTWLSKRYRVHLVCFAKHPSEVDDAFALEDRCASVRVELLRPARSLACAMVRFGLGGCLTSSYYEVDSVFSYVKRLSQTHPLAACVCFSSAVAGYAPRDVPLIVDFVDIDSEKWMQYGNTRWPGFAYRLEGRRLRSREANLASRAARSYLTTRNERDLLHSFTSNAAAEAIENGVDADYFDPAVTRIPQELAGRRILVFTGVMNYYPNAGAVTSFVSKIFPILQRRYPGLELFIVGRDPSRAVRRLATVSGVTVTGSVPDTRPYLAAATAVVVPLEIARGIQNKVLEALAMGKQVLASPAACATFGRSVPTGVSQCATAEDYAEVLANAGVIAGATCAHIREETRRRFSWERNLSPMLETIDSIIGAR